MAAAVPRSFSEFPIGACRLAASCAASVIAPLLVRLCAFPALPAVVAVTAASAVVVVLVYPIGFPLT